MKIEVKETRGRRPKYDFSGMELGETQEFTDTNTTDVLNGAKSYVARHKLKWKFRCYTDDGSVFIVRVE